MVDVAQLRVVVNADTAKAEKGLSSVNEKVKDSDGLFKRALSSALGYIGGAIGVQSVSDAFGLVKDSLVDVVKAGMDANDIDAQLAAGLRSTHDASGMTTDSLNALADSISGQTGITDDAVKSSESMLLTFTNIGKNVFPQATQAVSDLATKMANGAVPSSVQMEQASIQLGKALGDPTKGYAQLQRVGVTFNAQQVEQIKQMQKAGDVAGAQKVILAEMNKEFGGSADAAGQANGGIAILLASFDNMKEKVGQAIIPILNQLLHAIEPLVQSFSDWLPTALGAVQSALATVGPVLQSVGTWFGNLFTGLSTGKGPMSDMKGLLTPLKDAFVQVGANLASVVIPAVQQLGTWFQTTLVPAVQALMPHLEALGQVLITQVFPALVSMEGAAIKVWAVVESSLLPVIERLLPIILKLAGWLGDQLTAAFKVIMPSVQQAANTVSQFATQLQTRLGPAINNIFNFIQAGINFILPIWNAVWPSMQKVLAGVWTVIQGIIQVAWSLVSGIINVGLDILGGKWSKVWTDIQTMLGGVWSGIQNIIKGAITIVIGDIQGLVTGIISFFTHLWDKLVGHSIVPDMVNSIIGFFASLPGKALDAVGSLATRMIDFWSNLATNALDGGEALINGLISGVQNMAGSLGSALQGVVKGAVNLIPGGSGFLHALHIPGFASGGVMDAAGLALVGEQGPELVFLPKDAQVVPNVPTQPLGGATLPGGPGGSGGGQTTQVIQIVLDGRVLSESVVKNLPRAVRLATGLKI